MFCNFCLFLTAITLSKTLDYYTSEMTSSSNESVTDDNEAESDNRNLYDKAGKVTKRRSGTNNTNQDADDGPNIVSSNIKTIVVICSKLIYF